MVIQMQLEIQIQIQYRLVIDYNTNYFKADCEDKSDEQNCERMEQFYKHYRCL